MMVNIYRVFSGLRIQILIVMRSLFLCSKCLQLPNYIISEWFSERLRKISVNVYEMAP